MENRKSNYINRAALSTISADAPTGTTAASKPTEMKVGETDKDKSEPKASSKHSSSTSVRDVPDEVGTGAPATRPAKKNTSTHILKPRVKVNPTTKIDENYSIRKHLPASQNEEESKTSSKIASRLFERGKTGRNDPQTAKFAGHRENHARKATPTASDRDALPSVGRLSDLARFADSPKLTRMLAGTQDFPRRKSIPDGKVTLGKGEKSSAKTESSARSGRTVGGGIGPSDANASRKRPINRNQPKPEERKDARVDDNVIELKEPKTGIHRSPEFPDTFVVNYVDDVDVVPMHSGKGTESKDPFAVRERGGTAFPAWTKRGSDDVPASEVTSLRNDDKSDIIIMLRRRNSEPYAAKFPLQESVFPGGNVLANKSNVFGVNFENCCFWNPGLIHPPKPYWEVSLFKTNRSTSMLPSKKLDIVRPTELIGRKPTDDPEDCESTASSSDLQSWLEEMLDSQAVPVPNREHSFPSIGQEEETLPALSPFPDRQEALSAIDLDKVADAQLINILFPDAMTAYAIEPATTTSAVRIGERLANAEVVPDVEPEIESAPARPATPAVEEASPPPPPPPPIEEEEKADTPPEEEILAVTSTSTSKTETETEAEAEPNGRRKAAGNAARAEPKTFQLLKDEDFKPNLVLYVKPKDAPHKASREKERTETLQQETLWSRRMIVYVTSVVLLLTGGFAFMYFASSGPVPYFNLTPPIPGLVRGV